MPLSWVNSIEEWRPIRVARGMLNERGGATYALALRLPAAVSIAVNKVDGRDASYLVEEGHVRVEFGRTDPLTINGSPVQIIIAPGNNGLAPNSEEAKRRRCAIRDLVEEQLQELIRERRDLTFPAYDLEIIPLDMAGHTSGPDGVERSWGDPRSRPLPNTVRATDEMLG